MCTTVAKRLDNSWYLAKTRDPVPWMRWDDEIKLFDSKQDRFKKLIIQNPDPNEDGYYGGINEKGVAYISTFVRVAQDQVSYIRRPYVRLILDAKNAKEGIEIIKSFNPKIGGNMFIADRDKCFGIEGAPDKYFVEEIKNYSVKTNHFVNLPDKNLSFETVPGFGDWSKIRFSRASALIKKVKDIDDLKLLLRDTKALNKKNAICRTKKDVECFTHSAFIFDTKNVKVYYAQGNPLEVKFKEYNFTK